MYEILGWREEHLQQSQDVFSSLCAESRQHFLLHCVVVADLHSNQPFGIFAKPIWSTSFLFAAFLDLLLAIHFVKPRRQNWCVCSPTYIDYKIEIFCWICRQGSNFFWFCTRLVVARLAWLAALSPMVPVTGISEFASPVTSPVLGKWDRIATRYRNCINSRFAGTWKSGPARLNRLPVLFLSLFSSAQYLLAEVVQWGALRLLAGTIFDARAATFSSQESPSLQAVWYIDVNPSGNIALQFAFTHNFKARPQHLHCKSRNFTARSVAKLIALTKTTVSQQSLDIQLLNQDFLQSLDTKWGLSRIRGQ